MNKYTIGAIIIGVLIVGFAIFSASPQATPKATLSFMESFAQTKNAVLLDVRTPGEFTAGHIAGAMNIDFDNASFASEIEKLDKSKTYYVYCRSGNRSGKAILLLKKAGIENIVELKGGIVANQSSITLVPANS